MDFADSLKTAIHPPHRAGYPFILGGIVLAVLGLLFWHVLAWIGLIFTLFCLYFFRDPERTAPHRVNVFLAPADGLVTSVEPAIPPPELGLPPVPMMRVATFLSVLDVHVNRAAIAGTVSRIAYHPGLFLNAADNKAADENERNSILFSLPNGAQAVIVQIAGLIARRIVCDLHEGQIVTAGERIGIIRFGSRTDLYLPPGCTPLVAVGQRMIGGETVIAELLPTVATAPLIV